MRNSLKTVPWPVDEVWGIDFETYYDSKYSLRRMATTEYITDEQFEAQMLSIRRHTWTKPRVLVGYEDIQTWFDSVDWSRAAMLGHHTHFDGLIASHHFGAVPAVYLDTLSMARPLMPIRVGGSLKALTEAFGRPGKTKAQALVDVKGKRLADMSKQEIRALAAYAGDDIDDTWFLYENLIPFVSRTEMALIDLTVRMYARPIICMDQSIVQKVYEDEVQRKQQLLDDLGVERKQLTSNNQFVEQLQALGVEPPQKISPTTGKVTYALAKGDLDFVELLNHSDLRVRTLVEARLAVKTSIAETRAARFSARIDVMNSQPVYLNYAAAKTWRWTGGDKSNYQNLGRGSPLREAIKAPRGHRLVIADQGQIEARCNAWMSGQDNIVSAFARGDDVYKLAASAIYNKPVADVTKDERFVGKVATLALGYQAGWQRFAEMLRLGQFGPPVDITDAQAQAIVKAWRQANAFIVANWRRMLNAARSAFVGRQEVKCGVFTFKGFEGRGTIDIPGGTVIRYDMLRVGEDGKMSYVTKVGRDRHGNVAVDEKGEEKVLRQHLYGGLIVENVTQALARNVVAHNMVQIADEIPDARIVMSTHDEIVSVVPTRRANAAARHVQRIMDTAPDFTPGLPLTTEVHVSAVYNK